MVNGLMTGFYSMRNVENMEAGSQLIATRNNVLGKSSQKSQSEDRAPDFLMDVLSKLLGFVKQDSVESLGNSRELNGLRKESPNLSPVESAFPKEQPENKTSVDHALSFPMETPDIKDQIKGKGDGDQENKTNQFDTFPSLESFFTGKGNILKDFLNKTEEANSSLNKILLLGKGEGPLTKSDQSPVDGTQTQRKDSKQGGPGLVNPKEEMSIGGQGDKEISSKETGNNSSLSGVFPLNIGEGPVTQSNSSVVDEPQPGEKGSGKGSPSSVNLNDESLVEGRRLKGSLDRKTGLNPSLDDNLLINKWKTFVEKISEPLAVGPDRNIADPEEEKLGFKKSIEHTPGKDNLKREEFYVETTKVQPTQDKQSFNSIRIQKVEGEPSENGKEKQPGVPLFIKEGFWRDPGGPLAVEDQEVPEMNFDFERFNNKSLSQGGDILSVKGSGPVQISPMDLKDQSLRDSTGTGKIIIDKHEPLNHFPKTLELDSLKDHYFSVKKQTSSSMEISLEPAGLGKLDIELKLTQDRLQGQIMVNDTAGKELIEKNLPQLLSDLTREGLQIGGFTVSLKNQGRGQTPVPIRTEFKEPSLVTVGPERIVPIQGDHLVHIII